MASETISPDSKVWIYQADRTLSREEQIVLHEKAAAFVDQWNAHGAKLKSAYEFLHERFLVFFVDESLAEISGCSIDSSVALVKELQAEFGVDFLNRQIVAYRDENQILTRNLNDFWALKKAGVVQDETLVFNNLVKTKGEFDRGWEVPFSESWHAEMFR